METAASQSENVNTMRVMGSQNSFREMYSAPKYMVFVMGKVGCVTAQRADKASGFQPWGWQWQGVVEEPVSHRGQHLQESKVMKDSGTTEKMTSWEELDVGGDVEDQFQSLEAVT